MHPTNIVFPGSAAFCLYLKPLLTISETVMKNFCHSIFSSTLHYIHYIENPKKIELHACTSFAISVFYQWPCISSISSKPFNLSNPSLIRKRILCFSLQFRFFSISCLIVCFSSTVKFIDFQRKLLELHSAQY